MINTKPTTLSPHSPHSPHSVYGRKILALIQKYDHEKYWRRRSIVIDSESKISLIKKLWYLYYIKKTDAYHGCSFGTNINTGAKFLSPPILPHGPAGIIIGHDVVIGKKVVIFQQVTVAEGNVIIGNRARLGAGSKILPNSHIGIGAKIGANCVVFENIPDGATAVLPKTRIILHQNVVKKVADPVTLQ